MSTMDRRHAELACDAAVFGVGNAELAELAGCEAIDPGLALELELLVAQLAVGLTEVQPLPEKLRADLLARAMEVVAPPPSHPEMVVTAPREVVLPDVQPAERVSIDVIPIAPRLTPRVGRANPWLGWAMALAAAIVAVVAWSSKPIDRRTDASESVAPSPSRARDELIAMTGTVVLPFAATEDSAARGASGDVVWHSGVQRGYMRIKGLQRNDAEREQYQLWVFDGTRDDRYPVDGGVFDIDSDGDVIIPIRVPVPVRTATLFAVTVERPGGVVVSNRERIVLAAK